VHTYDHKAGVLDCALSQNNTIAYSGGCDNLVMRCDLSTGSASPLFSKSSPNHEQPIRCVQCDNDNQCVISGSWDKTIKVWDERKSDPLVLTHNLPSKVFAMSASKHRLILGCSGREIYIYDLRNMKEPEQKRESSLKHQTRAICGHPNGEQFILSSIEGRVGIEYFDPSPEVQQKKFAFKCHRSTDKSTMVQTIYPVNCVAIHPMYGTFATGGCDGIVNVWDMDNKKRIFQFPAFQTSIASIDFSGSGNQLLAIAQSYTWEQGPSSHPKDSIFIRRVKESELKPKQKKR